MHGEKPSPLPGKRDDNGANGTADDTVGCPLMARMPTTPPSAARDQPVAQIEPSIQDMAEDVLSAWCDPYRYLAVPRHLDDHRWRGRTRIVGDPDSPRDVPGEPSADAGNRRSGTRSQRSTRAQMGAIGSSPHTDRPGERPGHRRRGQDRKAQRRRPRREVTEEAIARRQRQPARRRASHRASGSAAVPARGGLVTRRCGRDLAGLPTIQSTSPMVAMSRASTTRG
jgi:hypothetical protein